MIIIYYSQRLCNRFLYHISDFLKFYIIYTLHKRFSVVYLCKPIYIYMKFRVTHDISSPCFPVCKGSRLGYCEQTFVRFLRPHTNINTAKPLTAVQNDGLFSCCGSGVWACAKNCTNIFLKTVLTSVKMCDIIKPEAGQTFAQFLHKNVRTYRRLIYQSPRT